jgi:TonB family protein
MMTDRQNKRRMFGASIPGALLVLISTAVAGEESSTRVMHFIDTATDRVPSLTAFPKYPTVARRDRIEGEATVCFKIKLNGKISRPVVTEYSHRIFSRPVLRAIKKSNFEPLGPGQILATARTCRTFRFRLDPILASDDTDE